MQHLGKDLGRLRNRHAGTVEKEISRLAIFRAAYDETKNGSLLKMQTAIIYTLLGDLGRFSST